MRPGYHGDILIGEIVRRAHPSQGELEDYLLGDMAEGRGLRAIEAHLLWCSVCQDAAQEIGDSEALIRALLRDALQSVVN